MYLLLFVIIALLVSGLYTPDNPEQLTPSNMFLFYTMLSWAVWDLVRTVFNLRKENNAVSEKRFSVLYTRVSRLDNDVTRLANSLDKTLDLCLRLARLMRVGTTDIELPDELHPDENPY